MNGLLNGLTVLDLGWGLAGPLVGMMCADNGADVIKVEPPGGEPFRHVAAAHVWNRGKRSLALDLKSAGGVQALIDLCRDADVLIENFRHGKADELGIGYARLHKANPRLVYASITGYGSESPRKDRPGYEHLVDAWLGLPWHVQCYRDGPGFNAFPIASYGAAFLATTGILAALRARQTTGRGQRVETSLVDGAFALGTMSWQWSERPVSRVDMTATKPSLPRRLLLTMGVLECGDGRHIIIHTGVPGRFAAALQVLGILDKVTPAAPAVEKNTPLTDEERAFLLAEIPRILKTRPRQHWIEQFQAADVCCLPIDQPGAVWVDPQTIYDATVVAVDDPHWGDIRMTGPTLKCPQAPPRIGRAAPTIGEHNAELLPRTSTAAAAAPALPQAPGALLGHPLKGVKIVDFGSYYAGPAASRILCDLGAEVIKVEPLQGDTLRGTATAFRAAQRGKRSISVDLKAPAGREIAHRLVARADIVTHNMRPGAAERLGLGYKDLLQVRPDLIYLYSPGFGPGPRAHLPAFAPLLSGMAGLHWQAAGRGNPPVSWWITNEDQIGGCMGAIWALMGLWHRRATGRSVYLEASLFNAALFASSEVVTRPDGEVLFRFELDNAQTGYHALCRMYAARDGWVMIVAAQEREWRRLGLVLGLEALASDARFGTISSRKKHETQLTQIIAAWVGAHTAQDAWQLLDAAGVPAEIVQPAQTTSFFLNEENLHSGQVVEFVQAEYGRMRELGHAIRFSETPGYIHDPAPLLGEHTQEILAELGYPATVIEQLTRDNVVRRTENPLKPMAV